MTPGALTPSLNQMRTRSAEFAKIAGRQNEIAGEESIKRSEEYLKSRLHTAVLKTIVHDDYMRLVGQLQDFIHALSPVFTNSHGNTGKLGVILHGFIAHSRCISSTPHTVFPWIVIV